MCYEYYHHCHQHHYFTTAFHLERCSHFGMPRWPKHFSVVAMRSLSFIQNIYMHIYIIYTHGSYQHHWHHELSLSSSQVRQPNPIKVKMWTMKNCFRQPSPTHNSLRWTWINCWVASVKWRSNAPTLSERPFLGVSGSF